MLTQRHPAGWPKTGQGRVERPLAPQRTMDTPLLLLSINPHSV
ncbi:hypothetical protein ABQZ29_22610 [Xanthomonas sp. WHRI 10200]|nr:MULTISPECIES: hypothetical protein [unclassified Xanthomonas]MEA9589566.1 hypothetical protein [Xanthomonas sp. WHRI 10064B]